MPLLLLYTDEAELPPKKQKAIKPVAVVSPTKAMKISLKRLQATKPSKPKKKAARALDPVQQKPSFTKTEPPPSPADMLPVQFSRSRLHGLFGLPYSGEVQVLESGSALPPTAAARFGGELVSVDPGGGSGDVEFALESPTEKGVIGSVVRSPSCKGKVPV